MYVDFDIGWFGTQQRYERKMGNGSDFQIPETTIGFDAVQQINTARTLFNCDRAILVTTSTLTQQAKETAKKLKVEVYERFHAGSVIS